MSIERTRTFWDEQAATFDDEADHGLKDLETREAWAALLSGFLGDSREAVVDLGCGTGSVSALLAERGHSVFGVDVSPKMIDQARDKALLAALDIEFAVGDLQTSPVPESGYGAVVSRHVLWAVTDPGEVVARWSAPLGEDGMFIAVEGVWNGAGIPAEKMFPILASRFQHVEYRDLSDHSILWGKEVTDDRYVIVGRLPKTS